MKIAIIIERADITLGGAERSVFELASALQALGLKAHILAAKGQTNAKNIHILCQNTHGRRTGLRRFAKVLKKHLTENQYDIIHSVLPFGFADIYQPRGGTYIEAILRNAASYQNKLIESYKRITAFTNLRRGRLLRAEKKLCKNPEGPVIAALSQYVAKQFKRHYRADVQRIAVISNGVRTHKQTDVNEADKLRSQILAQLDLKEADNPVFFLFVANNFRLKGLRSLIKAMRLVQKKRTARPAYLIIAGMGKPHKYRLLAKRFNVHNRIVFLGKFRHIQNALAIVDVAVLPTFYDPCSRYILEALAAEKPVITTKFNGAIDLFVDNRHGKIIDSPNEIKKLAEAIRYFTNTENIQNASHAIVEDNLKEKISIRRCTEKLKSLYEQILEIRRLNTDR